MFTTPLLERYRIEEYIGFNKDFLGILKTKDTAVVANQLATYEAAFEALSKDFKQDLANELTPVIRELDKRRDACIVGIRGVAFHYTKYYKSDTAAAAEAVLKSIDKYGKDIARMNYQAQTIVLDNLLSDWEDAALSAAFDSLHLADWVNELRSVNTEFTERRTERRQTLAADNTVVMDAHRKNVTAAYRTLRDFVGANALLNPSENWTVLIREHNTLAEEYNALLSRRVTTTSESTEEGGA
jgi:hypothetical protein